MNCTAPGCAREVKAKGLCRMHHLRLLRNGHLDLVRVTIPAGGPCSVGGCSSPARGRGMCTKHYGRFMRHGDPLHVDTQVVPVDVRLKRLSTVNAATGCHEWDGKRNEKGYGHAWDGSGMVFAHRLAYAVLVGPISDGQFVLHRCDNPCCINPEHLFLGTHAENMADMRAKGRSVSDKRPRGENNVLAKLTEEAVRQIKQCLAEGQRNVDLAREFGVKPDTISNIKRGLSWAHVRT